jgi:hypothetical protein
VPVFQLYNKNSNTHLYTSDVNERDSILAAFPTIWEINTNFGFGVAQNSGTFTSGGASQVPARRSAALGGTSVVTTPGDRFFDVSADSQRNSSSVLGGLVAPVIRNGPDAVTRGSILDHVPSSPRLADSRTGSLRDVTENAATLDTKTLRGISMFSGLDQLTDDLFAAWDEFAEQLP